MSNIVSSFTKEQYAKAIAKGGGCQLVSLTIRNPRNKAAFAISGIYTEKQAVAAMNALKHQKATA